MFVIRNFKKKSLYCLHYQPERNQRSNLKHFSSSASSLCSWFLSILLQTKYQAYIAQKFKGERVMAKQQLSQRRSLMLDGKFIEISIHLHHGCLTTVTGLEENTVPLWTRSVGFFIQSFQDVVLEVGAKTSSGMSEKVSNYME